jgi:hypothetical protein
MSVSARLSNPIVAAPAATPLELSVNDFREFLFRATGKDTDLGKLDRIDLYDNLAPEVDRLKAMAELLEDARDDELSAHVGSGLALLLGDIASRMRRILDLAVAKPGKKATR